MCDPIGSREDHKGEKKSKAAAKGKASAQTMSCKMVSGGEPRFQLCSETYQPTKLSSLGCSTRLSFDTKLSMPSLSVKTASAGSFRTMAMASTIDTYCTQDQTMETFYDLLGISESVTLPEIKKAYKQLARKYHPDVSPPDRIEEHTRRFIMVKEAYDTLSDPHSRAIYDGDLSGGLHLNFSDRKGNEMGEWKNKWQSQLHDLKRRSMNKNHKGKASWGARMRSRRRDD